MRDRNAVNDIFSHFIFLYFIKAVRLVHGYIKYKKDIFGHVGVGRHARVKSGSRCWSSPGLLMFVTSPPPIRDGFSVIKSYCRGYDGLSTDISTAG